MKNLKITSLFILALLGGAVGTVQGQSQNSEVDEGTVFYPDITKPYPVEDPITMFAVNNSDMAELRLKLFPNPNNGKFIVKIDPGFKGGKMHISNILGQVVYTKTVDARQEEVAVELNNLPRGIYLITLGNSTVKFKVI